MLDPGCPGTLARNYRYLLRAHLTPTFGDKTIAQIKEGNVRTWRKKLLDTGVSEVTTANAYRLLKART